MLLTDMILIIRQNHSENDYVAFTASVFLVVETAMREKTEMPEHSPCMCTVKKKKDLKQGSSY